MWSGESEGVCVYECEHILKLTIVKAKQDRDTLVTLKHQIPAISKTKQTPSRHQKGQSDTKY